MVGQRNVDGGAYADRPRGLSDGIGGSGVLADEHDAGGDTAHNKHGDGLLESSAQLHQVAHKLPAQGAPAGSEQRRASRASRDLGHPRVPEEHEGVPRVYLILWHHSYLSPCFVINTNLF